VQAGAAALCLTVAERLRDTLVHELCHAVVWIEHKLTDGHGNLWKRWYSSTTLFTEPACSELLHSWLFPQSQMF